MRDVSQQERRLPATVTQKAFPFVVRNVDSLSFLETFLFVVRNVDSLPFLEIFLFVRNADSLPYYYYSLRRLSSPMSNANFSDSKQKICVNVPTESEKSVCLCLNLTSTLISIL